MNRLLQKPKPRNPSVTPRSRQLKGESVPVTLATGNGSRRVTPAWARMPEINTWRAFEENISQQVIMEFVEQWEAHGYRFGCFTIDEGWTRREAAFGDWVPDTTRFPNLRGLVDWLHHKGIHVRLWVAPMLANEGSQLASSPLKKHFLVGGNGKQVRQFGRNAVVLDARVPAVQEYIRATMERLTRDFDVDGYKVDFCLTKETDRPSGYPNDDLSDEQRIQIHRAFFGAVREGCDAVKKGVRLESYPLEHCAEYIDDVLFSDLIGHDRTQQGHETINTKLLNWERAHGWVAWPEMVWGLGSDKPTGNPDWERTYLEWLATDINFERKIEHSFPPFDYTNNDQIRTLTNLYASGGPMYKVAHAGHITFDLPSLLGKGITLSPANHFLVAPSSVCEVHFVVPPCCGMPSQWEVINLLRPERVRCLVRDENWEDGKRWRCLRFTVRAGDVYEIRRRAN